MRPEQILADGQQTVEVGGLTVRKGSVAALMASWRQLNDVSLDAARRQQAEVDLLALVPGVAALGLFELFSPREAGLAALVEKGMARLPPGD